ncbi:MAG TPA: helix-turn-helix domain-containing protein [Gemmataceae bacterium]|jgi:excisionase family DNA binding protein|nr:helix-turn-helix domain-containing protein [Gemmataceae bacterium]
MNTVKAAALRMNVSEKTIYALCAAKKLRHVRVGVRNGKLLVPDDAIEDYLRSNTVSGAASVPAPRAAKVKLQHLRV